MKLKFYVNNIHKKRNIHIPNYLKMSVTTGKQLNNLFEKIYVLFENTIISSTYLTSDQYVQNTIIEFMDLVEIKSEWELDDAEREGFGKIYFESGYHDSNAVYYPFEDTNDIGIFKYSTLSDVWESALECIIEYCDEEEHIDTAKDLMRQLNEIKDIIIS